MVEYLTGEGFEPSGFKRITEALTALEMSEICEIVKFIKE